MSKQMTPCERLGYKVGDKFEVISHHAFKNGQVVTLHEDDGTECPLFAGDGGGAGVFDGVECSFATLNKQVRKIANKLKPAKQSLADAINQNGWWVEGGDWHKNGELPPVGEVCEILGAFGHYQEWFECKIIAEHNGSVFAANERSWMNVRKGERQFRPLRTERDVLIEIIKKTDDTDDRIADAILAAGFSLGAK